MDLSMLQDHHISQTKISKYQELLANHHEPNCDYHLQTHFLGKVNTSVSPFPLSAHNILIQII